jgi:CDP-diacylglycerol--glycerol-3-phosphate 3-phosphatidyltransferase
MTLANWLTVGRIFIVPFFVISLAYYEPGNDKFRFLAFALFLIASITDALDGFIARHWNQKSTFGTLADPLADKLLVVAGFLTIFWSSDFPMKPPLWITIIVVSRDIAIIAGLLVIFVATGRVEVRPNFLGKLTTAFQMSTLVGILLLLPFSPLLWNVTAVLTVLSGIFYVVREGKRLNGTNAAS